MRADVDVLRCVADWIDTRQHLWRFNPYQDRPTSIQDTLRSVAIELGFLRKTADEDAELIRKLDDELDVDRKLMLEAAEFINEVTRSATGKQHILGHRLKVAAGVCEPLPSVAGEFADRARDSSCAT